MNTIKETINKLRHLDDMIDLIMSSYKEGLIDGWDTCYGIEGDDFMSDDGIPDSLKDNLAIKAIEVKEEFETLRKEIMQDVD